MSNRSIVELNHDFAPGWSDAELLAWARKMNSYLHGADPGDLPVGVTRLHYRHHSEPCPMQEPKP